MTCPSERGWVRVRLADVARIVTGKTPSPAISRYWGGAFPFVTPGDLSESIFHGQAARTLTDGGKAVARLVPKRSSLVTCIGSSVGKVAFTVSECTTNQQINAATARAGTDPLCLHYALEHASERISAMAGNTAVPLVTKGQLENFRVLLPPGPVQESVGATLYTCDTGIALLGKLITAKRTFKRALMQDLLTGRRRFGEFVGQPTPRVRAGDICDIRIGGTPRRDTPKYWASSGDGFPWVSIADLKSGLVCDTSERITLAGVQESNVKLITAGTTIMSFKLTIGRTAKAGCDLYTNEAIAGFVPLTETVSNDFLRLILPLAVHSVSPETAVKGATLNKGKLTEIILRLPSLPEQERICAVGEVLDREIACCEQLLNQHELLKRGLMQKLLSGEIAVPDRIGTPD